MLNGSLVELTHRSGLFCHFLSSSLNPSSLNNIANDPEKSQGDCRWWLITILPFGNFVFVIQPVIDSSEACKPLSRLFVV